jgi:hypothetical protein
MKKNKLLLKILIKRLNGILVACVLSKQKSERKISSNEKDHFFFVCLCFSVRFKAFSNSMTEQRRNTSSYGSMSSSGIQSHTEPTVPNDHQRSDSPLSQEAVWEEDDQSCVCRGCFRDFTWSRRRHHCRRCGLLFCDACCPVRSTTTTGREQQSAFSYRLRRGVTSLLLKMDRWSDVSNPLRFPSRKVLCLLPAFPHPLLVLLL